MPLEQDISSFLNGPAVRSRHDQIARFRPVAREILREFVSKEHISDDDLSALIHLFRPKPVSRELAGRYLAHIVPDAGKAAALADQLVATGLGGFTAPGRLRIHSHTPAQLRVVHDFLRQAFAVSTTADAARLCREYDRKNIRYVTPGIYSPWLHYIAPDLFPIMNGATRSFYRAQGLPNEYSELIEGLPALTARLGISDLGLLDWYIYQHANGEQKDPKDGAWRAAKWISEIPREDWELFFDTCNEVIERFGIENSSPLLAMNIHLDAAQGVLMNISNRVAVAMLPGEGTEMLLMLPKGATRRLLDRNVVHSRFDFSKPANAEGTRVAADTLRKRSGDLLPAVMEAVEEIMGRSQSSPYRKHHIPDLYRMATDADFREKALDVLLEGRGEWPGGIPIGSGTGYWVFQADPKWYDVVGALRDNAVDRWSVDAHKKKIEPGDKVILWVTGPEGGCHALATVGSRVEPMPSDVQGYARTPKFEGVRDRVLIRIDHNLWDRPISKAGTLEHLPGLKVGIQGTTFSATREQYEFFLQRAVALKPNAMHDLNTILYGPPGTGKTFHTVTHAVAIIEQLPLDKVREECMSETGRKAVRARFEKLVKQRRILMTTFHQSMSYEDFVEGIKPTTSEGSDQVSYTIEPGIFKRVCAEAAFEYVKPMLASAQRDIPFDELFSAYTDSVEEVLHSGKEVKIPTRTGKELQIVGITERGNIRLRHVNHATGREYVVSLERSRALNAAFDDLGTIANMDREFREVIGGSNGTAYWAVLNQVRSHGRDLPRPEGAARQELLLEDKLPHVERIDWSDRTFATKNAEPFVLIIDEINRGNIAGIFGELITLIEPDKRAFQVEVAQVMLPYSKKLFAVPPNLFILGTMNTADRSVEALDTALRRRFSFVEMPCRPDLVEQPASLEVDLRLLLGAINNRIERLLDRDHHLGHSYFMGIATAKDPEDELRLVFKNKVLPLLQEYFYGDPRKLGAVLGERWVSRDKEKIHSLKKGYDLEDAEKAVFTVADPMNKDDVPLADFISIYA